MSFLRSAGYSQASGRFHGVRGEACRRSIPNWPVPLLMLAGFTPGAKSKETSNAL